MILLVSLSLTNCANINRSEVGGNIRYNYNSGSCRKMVTDPYLIAVLVTAFAGAEIMYKSQIMMYTMLYL